MSDRTDSRLLRHLHGELPAEEAQRLRRELQADPRLAARLAELQRGWQGLELPPPASPPPGWAARVARLGGAEMERAGGGLRGLGAAPPWARGLVAAALAAGVMLGIGLGGRLQLGATAPADGADLMAAAGATAAGEPDAARAGGAERALPAEPVASRGGGEGEAAPPLSTGETGSAPGASAEGGATTAGAPAAADVPSAEPVQLADAATALATGDEALSDAAALLGGDEAAYTGGSTLAEAYWDVFAGGEAGW